MTIGELARRSGLNPSRIRFYESRGLLNVVQRAANGYRYYSPEALVLLNIIVAAQEVGFSLDESREIVPGDLARGKHDKLVQTLWRKISDIEAMEKRLATSKLHLKDLIHLIESRPE